MSNSPPIRLIVGLGNPGPEYADTRHNAGLWFLQRLARQWGGTLSPDKRFFGELARIKYKGNDICLLFPATYMNRSGQAVGALAGFYKITPAEILVAHDELDLQPGQLKLKQGGGHAGHNGLRDIASHLGTPTFWRARIGIGHPRSLGLTQSVSDFVLHRPSAEHQSLIDTSTGLLLDHMDWVTQGNLSVATTQVHTAVEAMLRSQK